MSDGDELFHHDPRHHNHFTRDIKPLALVGEGGCNSCNKITVSGIWDRVKRLQIGETCTFRVGSGIDLMMIKAPQFAEIEDWYCFIPDSQEYEEFAESLRDEDRVKLEEWEDVAISPTFKSFNDYTSVYEEVYNGSERVVEWTFTRNS